MNWNSKENTRLIESILAVKTKKEARRFMRDLMTEKEISEFAKRIKAAEMLLSKIPYLQIQKETGLSSTTVARVSKWLNRPQGGYKTVLNRIHHHSHPSREEIGCG